VSLLPFPTMNSSSSATRLPNSEPPALRPELSLSDQAAVVENLLRRVIRSRPDALEALEHVLVKILEYESGKTLAERRGDDQLARRSRDR
jgi:hypothetical protein